MLDWPSSSSRWSLRLADFTEFDMTDAKAGRLVQFEDRDGHVIATDDKGQRFITPAGRFDWHPLDPPQPVPPPSRWRRAAA